MFRMQANHPDRILRAAVRGMLPKTSLGRQMLRRLKIYADEVHPHGAQVKDMAREELLVAPPEVARPVLAEVEVSEPREVGWWALQWGACAEVLEPEGLRREVGETQVRLEGKTVTTLVEFGDEGAPALPGVYTLEAALLAVDPVGQRFVPTEALLMIALS